MPRLAAITERVTRQVLAGETVPRAEAKALLTDDVIVGYRPNLPAATFWDGSNDTPWLQRVILDVEAMLAHPRVLAALGYYKAGIANAEIDHVEASSPDVERFATTEFLRFWQTQRLACQRSYDYGRGGYECIYSDEDGVFRLRTLRDFFPMDVGVLTKRDQYCGLRVRSGAGRGDAASVMDLWGPGNAGALPAKAFWLSHNRRYSRWYGWPQLYGSWRPWRRLAGRDGAEEIVDGGVYRFAFKPPIGRYPQNDEMPRPTAGQTGLAYGAGNGLNMPPSNRDKMREFLEVIKSGGVVAFSSRRDEHGQYVWDADFPDHAIAVDGLLLYTANLERAVSLGIGVPPELLEASEVGSGYSGRAIPLQAFFWQQQQNAEELLESWREQIGLPLVRWNFGPDATFRLILKPLLQSAMKAAAAEGSSSNGSARPPQPEGRPEPSPQSFATDSSPWTQKQGERGGHYWLNSSTGEKRYQKERPDASDEKDPKADKAKDLQAKDLQAAKDKLAGDIADMHQTAEGRRTLAEGTSLAEKVKTKVADGVKAALDGLDAESGGGLSLLAGALKSKDPKALAIGTSRLVSMVYSCVHEEMFELLLSQQTGGPALVAKLGSKAAAKGVVLAENALGKAAAWAWSKITEASRQVVAAGTHFATVQHELTAADRQLLDRLAGIAHHALAELYRDTGVRGELPATSELVERLQQLAGQGEQFATASQPGDEQRLPFDAGDPDVQDPDVQSLLALLLDDYGALAAQIEAALDQAVTGALTPEEGYARARQTLENFQPQIVQTLTEAQLAALLTGMGQVARRLPASLPSPQQEPPPPALSPYQASSLLQVLRGLTPPQQSSYLDALLPEVAGWARGQLAGGEPPEEPGWGLAAAGQPGDVRLPLIDAAVRDLRNRRVLTRETFDRLAADARKTAFTVAGIESEATLQKVQEALANTVEEGASFQHFRDKLDESLDEGTLLSRPHMETVYRTNVQAAYSAGQDQMIAHVPMPPLAPALWKQLAAFRGEAD